MEYKRGKRKYCVKCNNIECIALTRKESYNMKCRKQRITERVSAFLFVRIIDVPMLPFYDMFYAFLIDIGGGWKTHESQISYTFSW